MDLAEQQAMAQAEQALVSIKCLEDLLPDLIEQTQSLPVNDEIVLQVDVNYDANRT